MDKQVLQQVGIAVAGIVLGVALTVATRSRWEAWASACPTCGTKTAQAAAARKCPARFVDGKLVVTDRQHVDELRLAMRDGVYRPWFELGRAPTPDEMSQ